jgi:acetyl-CoA synthetase (ADP-forming)
VPSTTLSEHESKRLLAEAGIPVPQERLARDAEEAVRAAEDLGYPVALKLCARGLAHKTERGLVRLDIVGEEFVREHAEELLARRTSAERDAALLVAPMVQGRRELIAGLVRDPQFGPCVMLGLGGIAAEVLDDVAFATAPLGPGDAEDLIGALRNPGLLGELRGDPPVDRAALARVLEGLGRLAELRPDVRSVDLNPLIVAGSTPIVVDALVELEADA